VQIVRIFLWAQGRILLAPLLEKSLAEPLDEKARRASCILFLREFETRLERMRPLNGVSGEFS